MKEKQVFIYNQFNNTNYYFEKCLYNVGNVPVVCLLTDINYNFYLCYTTDHRTHYGYAIAKILPIIGKKLENNEITIYDALTSDPNHIWIFNYDLNSHHCSKGELYNLSNIPQKYLPPKDIIIGDTTHIW